MLDIGWSELLVIAIVLIVVVGPKDLPPMIRAFGRTMANLRKVTGEFRTQFDQALKEADMDDVRKTVAEVQNLNPTNALRDAINPLRQMGQDIRGDLEKSVSTTSASATAATPVSEAPFTDVKVPEPSMVLPASPPVVPIEAAVETTAAPKAAKASKARPAGEAAKPRSKKAAATEVAEPAVKKPATKKAAAKKKVEKVDQ